MESYSHRSEAEPPVRMRKPLSLSMGRMLPLAKVLISIQGFNVSSFIRVFPCIASLTFRTPLLFNRCSLSNVSFTLLSPTWLGSLKIKWHLFLYLPMPSTEPWNYSQGSIKISVELNFASHHSSVVHYFAFINSVWQSLNPCSCTYQRSSSASSVL